MVPAPHTGYLPVSRLMKPRMTAMAACAGEACHKGHWERPKTSVPLHKAQGQQELLQLIFYPWKKIVRMLPPWNSTH